jgi:CheY-like chemotaxis protein
MIANLAVRRGVPAKAADPDHGRARQANRPLRTLVLDDEWLNADLIAMMAEDCGSEIVGVANTATAAAIFADAQSPELALIDVQLGQGADGIIYAESLRKRHGTLIAIMTGAGDIAT